MSLTSLGISCSGIHGLTNPEGNIQLRQFKQVRMGEHLNNTSLVPASLPPLPGPLYELPEPQWKSKAVD
jgi:hypothetical protein